MIPDLVINKIYWYIWRLSIDKVCKEYYSKFGYDDQYKMIYYIVNNKGWRRFIPDRPIHCSNIYLWVYWHEWFNNMCSSHNLIKTDFKNIRKFLGKKFD